MRWKAERFADIHGIPLRHSLHLLQRFFFALFSSFRFLLNLPLLDRPLTLGFFWGLLTGDWSLSLGVSLFFELLWLDVFPAGTIIPPQSLAPTLASLCVLDRLDVSRPGLAAAVILLTLPLGKIFSRIESFHRQLQNDAFEQLLTWAREPGEALGPLSLTVRSALIMLPMNMAAFAAVLAVLLSLCSVVLPWMSQSLEALPVTWPHLWVVASIGAVLSLRHRPAYAILLGGVGLALASRLLF